MWQTRMEGLRACLELAATGLAERLSPRGRRRGNNEYLEDLMKLSAKSDGRERSLNPPPASWPMPGIEKYL